MRGTVQKTTILLMAVLALGLSIGWLLTSGRPAEVQAAPSTAYQKPDNSQCLGCHSAPGQVFTFPNGDTVSITVDPETYDQGVHTNLACQVCHTNITGYPHPKNVAQSAREYTLQYQNSCNQCHTEQAKAVMDNAHHQLAVAGNPNTPVCADCHNPHATAPIAKDENGDPAPSEHAKIATICGQCHSEIVNQYKGSVHGAGVFEEFNPDVPACDDCHGIHDIAKARTEQFRLNSPELCAECHTNKAIMDKYGISTNVLNTYVSDFHGTTWTLFEKDNPQHATNKPVCYDCHGIHAIKAVDDPEKGLQVKQNMLAACRRCHPDATENFPDSWMSHYIPDPQRTPLVYYVQLFYNIFIPGVLGGMAIFVAADIYGRFRRRGKHHPSTPETKE